MTCSPLTRVVRQLRKVLTGRGAGDPTDGQLLERFATLRDELAFASLVRRHGPMVLGVCLRVLHHEHDAEDAFQATFLVLARKADSIGRPELLGNWLYGVAYRIARKAKTNAARRRIHEKRAADMQRVEPPSEAAWPELRPVLDEELNRLPDKYRVPVVLCYLEGLTYEEAAQQLGWAKGTISGRLARARDLLRSRLICRGLALPAGVFSTLLTQNALSATVPVSLVASIVKAAALVAAGQTATAGGVSASVAALAEGVLKDMILARFKIVAAVMLAISVLGTGASVLTYHALATETDNKGQQALSLEEKSSQAGKGTPQPAAKEGEPAFVDHWKEQTVLKGHKHSILSVAFAPDGKTLASAGGVFTEPGEVRLWDVATGKERTVLKAHTAGCALVAFFSSDGKTLFTFGCDTDPKRRETGGFDNTVKQWDVATGKEQAAFKVTLSTAALCAGAAFAPDGKTLATSQGQPYFPNRPDLSGKVQLWDLATGKVQTTLKGQAGLVSALAFSPDGKTLATSSSISEPGKSIPLRYATEVKLWDVATAKERTAFRHETGLAYLTFSPDGKTLATAAVEGEGEKSRSVVKLWDTATGKPQATLARQADPLSAVAFAPDGKTLATAGLDKTVKLWDVATGKQLVALQGHTDSIYALAFAPDGRTIATGGWNTDTSVRLWVAEKRSR